MDTEFDRDEDDDLNLNKGGGSVEEEKKDVPSNAAASVDAKKQEEVKAEPAKATEEKTKIPAPQALVKKAAPKIEVSKPAPKIELNSKDAASKDAKKQEEVKAEPAKATEEETKIPAPQALVKKAAPKISVSKPKIDMKGKDDTDLEQLEGGEFELYDGGESEWIDIDKLYKEIQDAMKLTREKARENIIVILERIKKWQTKTQKSIKLMFRNQMKRNKVVTAKDLRIVLKKVVRPFEAESKHINAIM